MTGLYLAYFIVKYQEFNAFKILDVLQTTPVEHIARATVLTSDPCTPPICGPQTRGLRYP